MTEPIPADQERSNILETRKLSVAAGKRKILSDVHLQIKARQIFGLIGPSGAGKSTVLRCLNRLTDLDHGLRVRGEVLLHGRSIRHREVNVDELRMKIGTLFQQPVVFPTSILKNALFGVRRHKIVPRHAWPATAERALREVALWEEVKDRLRDPARKLSVGQQQRLCLARTLAVNPEIILMDEPTSALDPKSTLAIEGLIGKLKTSRTIVLVTHQLSQARRLCDEVAFVTAQPDGIGKIACSGTTQAILDRTDHPLLNDFLQTEAEADATCCSDDDCP